MSASKYKEDSFISSEGGLNNDDQPVAAVIACDHDAGDCVPLPVDGSKCISCCQLTYFLWGLK